MNGDASPVSKRSARMWMTINALFVLMTQFQSSPCTVKARHIARHFDVLAADASADPVARDLADGLCRHWLAVCHGYQQCAADGDLDDSRVLN